MRNLKIFLYILFSIIFGTKVLGQEFNFQFTDIPVSPISTAQGMNSVVPVIQDPLQFVSNPAQFDSTLDKNVQISYLNYLTDINQTSIGYSHAIDSAAMVAGYFRFIEYGSFIETNEVGDEIGEFRTSEYELGMNLTKCYRQNWYYGATLKQLFSSFYQNFAYGLAIDVGGYYQSKDGLIVGLTIDDIGARVLDVNQNGFNLMRPSANVGIAKRFAKAPLTLAVQYSNLETWDLAANDIDQSGNLTVDQLTGESKRKTLTMDNFARHVSLSAIVTPSDRFAIITGFDFRRRLELAASQRPALVGFSLGFQANVKRLNVQYGLSSYHINGSIHHLSISTNLNEWITKRSI